jgi:hypothetical protein
VTSSIGPIPARVHRLPELAQDLWWTWNTPAREVFRRLDYPLWRQTAHNPVLMLRLVSPEILAAAAADDRFVTLYDATPGGYGALRQATAALRIFPQSSRCISRSRFTPAASAFSPAITARKRETWGSR